jgi:hypothetical protein
LNRFLRPAVAGVCVYEAVAIATGLVPTVSRLCRHRPWLAGVVVGGLVWHLQED